MSSASEAECVDLFIIYREVLVAKTALEEMGHPQQATPIQVYNSICDRIMNWKNTKTL